MEQARGARSANRSQRGAILATWLGRLMLAAAGLGFAAAATAAHKCAESAESESRVTRSSLSVASSEVGSDCMPSLATIVFVSASS